MIIQLTVSCLIRRKQDFRELKQLQREEMKEATEFYARIKIDREVQAKKFEIEAAVSAWRGVWHLYIIERSCCTNRMVKGDTKMNWR